MTFALVLILAIARTPTGVVVTQLPVIEHMTLQGCYGLMRQANADPRYHYQCQSE